MNRQKLIEDQLIKTTNYQNYNGWGNRRTDFGYHSFDIDEIHIRGQRIPKDRLNKIRSIISLENKNIIDFGCNVGGMLFHIPEMKNGLGFDYDINCVTAANNIKNILCNNKATFHQFDLDKSNYETLKDFISFKPDIIFLLSIGKWITNIEKLFDFCIKYESDIVLETNNKQTEKHHINYFNKNSYESILISDKSDDDILKKNYKRKTYLFRKV